MHGSYRSPAKPCCSRRVDQRAKVDSEGTFSGHLRQTPATRSAQPPAVEDQRSVSVFDLSPSDVVVAANWASSARPAGAIKNA